MFRIEYDSEALGDLKFLAVHQQKFILGQIQTHLTDQPDLRSQTLVELRPNEFFTWELRCHPYRVFYQIDLQNQTVRIQRIGRKEGNRIYIRGELFTLSS